MIAPASFARLALALALTVAAVGAAPPDPSGAPVEIYAFAALTGSNAFLGNEQAKGYQALEHYVNATGGLWGRPLHFIIQDDQTNPTLSNQLMSQAMRGSSPVVFGGGVVGTCNAAAALATATGTGPVMYCISSGVHPPVGSYEYSSGFSATDQMAALMRYFIGRGWTKIGIMTSTDGTGQDADRSLDELLARPEYKAISVVAREHFAVSDMSVAAQVSHVGTSGAQALLAWTTGSALGTVLHGMKDAGLDLPLGTTGGNLSYPQLTAYNTIVPSQLLIPGLPIVTPDQIKDRAVRAAVATALKAMAPYQSKPDIGAALPWDGGTIVINALRKLGPTATATQLRDAIDATQGFAGVFGIYNFVKVPQRGLDIDQVVITRWDRASARFVAASDPGGAPLK